MSVYPDLYITHTLWVEPGALAAIGTSTAPDPTQTPPTLAINGTLQVGGGAAITSFSTDASFSGPVNAAVPTQLAVQQFVSAQIQTRASLGGSSGQDFATRSLTVSGTLNARGTVQILGAPAQKATLNASNLNYSSAAPTDAIITITMQAPGTNATGTVIGQSGGVILGASTVVPGPISVTPTFTDNFQSDDSTLNITAIAVSGDNYLIGNSNAGPGANEMPDTAYLFTGQSRPLGSVSIPMPVTSITLCGQGVALDGAQFAAVGFNSDVGGGIGAFQYSGGNISNLVNIGLDTGQGTTLLALSGNYLLRRSDPGVTLYLVGQGSAPGLWSGATGPIAISGNLFAVGAPANSVSIYQINNNKVSLLTVLKVAAASLAMSGNYLLVGGNGQAWLYYISAGGATQIGPVITGPVGFGSAVAIGDNCFAVSTGGAVYFYSYAPGAWNTVTSISFGQVAALAMSGAHCAVGVNNSPGSANVYHYRCEALSQSSFSFPIRSGAGWQATLSNPSAGCTAAVLVTPLGTG